MLRSLVESINIKVQQKCDAIIKLTELIIKCDMLDLNADFISQMDTQSTNQCPNVYVKRRLGLMKKKYCLSYVARFHIPPTCNLGTKNNQNH